MSLADMGFITLYGIIDLERYFEGAQSILKLEFPKWPLVFFKLLYLHNFFFKKIFLPSGNLLSNIFINLSLSLLIYYITFSLPNKKAAILRCIIYLFYPSVQMLYFFISSEFFYIHNSFI